MSLKFLSFATALATKWKTHLFYTIFDQAIYSITFFLVNLYLANNTPREEYGTYALIISVYFLFIAIHDGFFLETLNYIKIRYHDHSGPTYYASVTALSLLSSLSVSIISVFVVGAVLEDFFLSLAIAAYFASSVILLTVRRISISERVARLALGAALTYGLAALGLFVACHLLYRVNNAIAFSILSAASLVACVVLRSQLARRRITSGERVPLATCRQILAEHVRVGRWNVAQKLVGWAATGIYVPLFAAIGGLTLAADFNAMNTMFLPLGQLVTILGIAALPTLSRNAADGRRSTLGRNAALFSGACLAATAAYVLGVLIFTDTVRTILFGPAGFAEATWMLPYLAVPFLIRSLVDAGVLMVMRADGRFRDIFGVTSLQAVSNVIFVLLLVYALGIHGLLISNILTPLLGGVLAFYLVLARKPR